MLTRLSNTREPDTGQAGSLSPGSDRKPVQVARKALGARWFIGIFGRK